MKAVSIGSNRRFAMSEKKPLALGILVWAVSFGVVRADPITWPSNFNWVAYFAGQTMAVEAATPLPRPALRPGRAVCSGVYSGGHSRRCDSDAQAAVNAPVSLIANAPVARPPSTPVSTPAASSGPVDAFINLGTGPYPLAGDITTGNAQPWYDSSQSPACSAANRGPADGLRQRRPPARRADI